jgi:hypothetical protein
MKPIRMQWATMPLNDGDTTVESLPTPTPFPAESWRQRTLSAARHETTPAGHPVFVSLRSGGGNSHIVFLRLAHAPVKSHGMCHHAGLGSQRHSHPGDRPNPSTPSRNRHRGWVSKFLAFLRVPAFRAVCRYGWRLAIGRNSAIIDVGLPRLSGSSEAWKT